MLGTYHMTALLDAMTELHHIHDREQLYLFMLNWCSDVLKAQGGTFFTVREELGELKPEASKGVSLNLLKEIPFKMSTGICGWVATTRQSVNIENAQVDKRFNRAVDVITGIRTRSILCVPIIRQAKIIGVVELVNRLDGVFREADLEFFQHLANQVGVALESCRLFEETSELLAYTNSVINSLTGGFISTDPQGIVTRCNHSASHILATASDEVVGQPLLSALPHYPAFSAILDVTLKHQTPVARQEIELQRPDGAAMLIGYSTFLIHNDAKRLLGAGIIFQDLTHLKRN